MHWWQVDWLSLPRRVLMLVFGSEWGQLGLGSDSAAIMAIPITGTATIRMDTIDPTMVTIMGRHTTGITGIEFITTIITIIITITIKLTYALRLGG